MKEVDRLEGYSEEFRRNPGDYKKHLAKVTYHFEGRVIVRHQPKGSVNKRILTTYIDKTPCKVIDQTDLISGKKTVYLKRNKRHFLSHGIYFGGIEILRLESWSE